MKLPARYVLTVFALCLMSGSALAQKSTQNPQKVRLAAVHVIGTSHYNEQDILDVTGLKVGSMVSEADFQNAANQLGSLGTFSSVQYKFEPKGNSYVLTFELEDANFLPVHFENFVWFSDEELEAELRKRIPLFRGAVPEGGQMANAVSDELAGMLRAKGISGQVFFRLHSRSEGAPPDAYQYLVSGVPMAVTEVNFTGVNALPQSEIEAASKNVINQNYEYSVSNIAPAENILRSYHRLGYLRAHVGVPQRKLLGDDPNAPQISLTFPVTESERYTVAGVRWTGNEAVKTSDLDTAVQMKPGDVASIDDVEKTLAAAGKIYGAHGYLAAQAIARQQLNDASHTVNYLFEIREGPVFHMGTFEITGLPKDQEAQIRQQWRLKPGDVFDDGYPSAFLNQLKTTRVGQVIKIRRKQSPGNVVHVTLEF
ncbi:MAG TPA: POTRA domain-containing protein [candidate division Zixibacteria bacterium]|nr:POTRA domain-containing protein [candidate division Zixibacteria bacterium]